MVNNALFSETYSSSACCPTTSASAFISFFSPAPPSPSCLYPHILFFSIHDHTTSTYFPALYGTLSFFIPCFQNHRDVFRTVPAKRVIRNYNRIATALIEFEILHYNSWKQSLIVADEGMCIFAWECIQCTPFWAFEHIHIRWINHIFWEVSIGVLYPRSIVW